jgi:hypothetical protein
MSDHRCTDDPWSAMFHAVEIDHDTGEKRDVGPILACSPEVDFEWDH